MVFLPNRSSSRPLLFGRAFPSSGLVYACFKNNAQGFNGREPPRKTRRKLKLFGSTVYDDHWIRTVGDINSGWLGRSNPRSPPIWTAPYVDTSGEELRAHFHLARKEKICDAVHTILDLFPF
jgi:hypothetical protein